MDKKTVLLVEDNPDDVKLTLRAFEKNRLSNEVVVVQDGEEALAYLFGTGKYAGADTLQNLAVVLLDLKLPKIDGMEVLRHIRANPRTSVLPVVILTSSREQKDVINGYQLGANSYIVKPVDFDKFLDAAKQLGLYWLVLNEPLSRKR